MKKAVSKGFHRMKDEFFYNKGPGLFVCTEEHMELKEAKTVRTTGRYNLQETHYFDIMYCQICPSKVGCYKEGAKSNMVLVWLEHQVFSI